MAVFSSFTPRKVSEDIVLRKAGEKPLCEAHTTFDGRTVGCRLPKGHRERHYAPTVSELVWEYYWSEEGR